MDRFLCITPMPPSLARATAISLSVTVSIAADNNGMFMVILGVSLVFKSTSEGNIFECCGTNNTSSNVKA